MWWTEAADHLFLLMDDLRPIQPQLPLFIHWHFKRMYSLLFSSWVYVEPIILQIIFHESLLIDLVCMLVFPHPLNPNAGMYYSMSYCWEVGCLRTWLSSEVSALLKGSAALIKGAQGSYSSVPPCEDKSRCHLWGFGPHQTPYFLVPALSSHPQKLWEKKLLLTNYPG